jgi:hypothetical protein
MGHQEMSHPKDFQLRETFPKIVSGKDSVQLAASLYAAPLEPIHYWHRITKMVNKNVIRDNGGD